MSRSLSEHTTRAGRYEFLSRRLGNIDVAALYKQLSVDLTMTSLSSGEKVAAALERVERNQRKASSLHQVTTDELAEFDLDWNKQWYEWESKARMAIGSTEGRKGVISSETVTRWVSANIAEYAPWERARRDLVRAERMTKTLVDCWISRAATLRKLLDKVMMRPSMDLNLIRRRGHDTDSGREAEEQTEG